MVVIQVLTHLTKPTWMALRSPFRFTITILLILLFIKSLAKIWDRLQKCRVMKMVYSHAIFPTTFRLNQVSFRDRRIFIILFM
jgi:hypothetical protein